MVAKATKAAAKTATSDEPVAPVVMTEPDPAAAPVEVAPGQMMSAPVTLAGAAGDAPTSKATGACVVDDGTHHNGLPVNGGKVCSAHENRYNPDGTKRG